MMQCLYEKSTARVSVAGTVESISYVSSGEGNQKYYSAYISFEADENVRLGLPAIVYLKDAENSDSEKEGE